MFDRLLEKIMPCRPERPSSETVEAARKAIEEMTPEQAFRVLVEEVGREPRKN